MSLAEKADLLVERHEDDAGGRRRGPGPGLPHRLGHREVLRLQPGAPHLASTSWSAAAASTPPPWGRRRPSAARIPSPSASTSPDGYEVIRRFDLPGHAERVASEAVALLTAPGVPRGHHRPRARVEPARPPDPRIGRPRHRARPDPRLGGGLRRHVVPRTGPPRQPRLRLAADEHHRRRHPARARSAPSATTTRARRPSGSTSSRTAAGSASSPGATPPPWPTCPPAAWSGATATTASPWSG